MTIPTKAVEVVERALHAGAKLRAFSSGGGLRVLRLETNGELVGYGEHPNVEPAFEHVAEDFEAGGRPYKEVYGKLHTHYLTGTTQCSSDLDMWIREGQKFEAFIDGEEVVFVLKGYQHNEAPEGYQERVFAGETLTWESRGYTYRMVPSTFPGNGETCASTEIVSKPEGERSGADPWMWRITKTGRAKTLVEAIRLAFEAESVEVPREE